MTEENVEGCTKTRTYLKKEYSARLFDIVNKLKEYSYESLLNRISEILPSNQPFLNWMIKNNTEMVKNYIFEEKARELVLNIQENDSSLIEDIFENLSPEPMPCCHCGAKPVIDTIEIKEGEFENLLKCETTGCLVTSSFENVEEWNETMNRFSK